MLFWTYLIHLTLKMLISNFLYYLCRFCLPNFSTHQSMKLLREEVRWMLLVRGSFADCIDSLARGSSEDYDGYGF